MIRENGPEEVETLLQSVLANVLLQHLVVLADGCQEHDQEDVLETVDPLPPFAPLATHFDLGKTNLKKLIRVVERYSSNDKVFGLLGSLLCLRALMVNSFVFSCESNSSIYCHL